MNRRMARNSTSAFTLIEILIVVVILGILAAIVIPQFTKASQDSALTATIVDLGRIRRSVEAYRVQNRDASPPVVAGNGTWGPLVSRGGEYMMQAPINQWVSGPNAREIVLGTGPDTAVHQNYGWIYDPATANVWAACFDANDKPLIVP